MVVTVSPNASIVSTLFERFSAEAINYCLLRNVEGLPNVIDGDIDILVAPDHLPKVEAILADLAAESLIVRKIKRNEHLQVFVVSPDEIGLAVEEGHPIEGVALDFQTGLQWKGIPYMDAEAVLTDRHQEQGFYVPGLRHYGSHLACHILLDKDYVKSEYRDIIREALSSEGEATFTPLIPSIGKAGVANLYTAFQTGDNAEILSQRKMITRKLLFSSLGSAPSCFLFLVKKYLRMAGYALAPPGILVATAGPDGAGKSTLIDKTALAFAEEFPLVKKQYMGWREFILPTKKLLGIISPSKNKASSEEDDSPTSGQEAPKPNWTYNLSILHYFADLWARYIFLIRPALSRGGLVLCDRYFYDVLVREAWVCRNRLFRWLLLRLTPKPTVTVLFTGDPEVIVARKQEVSSEEAARQMELFAVLDRHPEKVLKVDVSSPLDRNLADLVNAIVAKRTGDDAR